MQKSILFLSLLLPSLVARAQETPPAEQAPIVHEFGRDGATGSFRARFSRHGGGLVFLQTMDHYHSVEAGKLPTHGPNEFMLLAFSPRIGNGNDHALRLLGAHLQTGTQEVIKFPVDLATALWTYSEVPDGVKFSIETGTGLVIEKVWIHDPVQRGFRLEIAVINQKSAATGHVSFELNGAALVNKIESSLIGNTSVAIAAPIVGTPMHVAPDKAVVQTLAVDPKTLSFAGTTNRFFGAFLFPRDEVAAASLTGFHVDTLPPADDPDSGTIANSITRLRYGMTLAVPPVGGETRASYGLYFGPKSYRVFATLADPVRFEPILDVDLTSPCCIVEVPGGRMMAKILLKLLSWFHGVVGNWGLAIIMLTILVRGLLAPLNFRMQKSMRAYGARMAVLKPKLEALKVRHADDPKAYQQAMVAFQREHKMIPPIGGCLPIFLTMPIYIGLFTALRTAYDLRQQPFVGWIDDLSLSDTLFELSFWPHHFNLLPIVWIAMFVWMQLRMPLPTDPQARQMQTMMRYMPILFGVMLYGYAAALMVYMVTSMLWSLGESAITKRILGPIDPNVAAMAPTPM